MISFTFGEENFECYPPVDDEVRRFMCKELPEEAKVTILNTPKKYKISSKRNPQTPPKPRGCVQSREDRPSQSSEAITEEFTENLATTTWNHTRAIAFLHACFEVCKLH
jgi:hypothetical protein